jgi:hypothetical protein
MATPYHITSLRHAQVPTGTFIGASLLFDSGVALSVFLTNRPPTGGRYPQTHNRVLTEVPGRTGTWLLTVTSDATPQELEAIRWLFENRTDLVAALAALVDDELANPGTRHDAVACTLCRRHYGDAGPCDEGKPVNSPHRKVPTCPHCGGRGWHWTTCVCAASSTVTRARPR